MKHDSLHIATLIASRMCHDLINPIGAIQNGLELVKLSTDRNNKPAMELVEESSKNAVSRVKFFRIAFGKSNELSDLTPDSARDILSSLFNQKRLVLLWNIDHNINRLDAQLIFLSLLCLENAMPMGGEITVKKHKNLLDISGFSSDLSFNEEQWYRFSEPSQEHEVSPKDIQFLLLFLICKEVGKHVSVDKCVDDTKLSIRL